MTLVNVGTQVSGTVQKLNVDYNSRVQRGQVLAELDPRTYTAAVHQSDANLANASAQLELAQANAKRSEELFAKDYISRQDLDTAREAVKSSLAQRALAQAQLDRDRTNLDYTVIRSPVAGVVVSREIDVGQTVAASFQTPTLFKIAQDLSKMQIDSNFAEADVGNIRDGEPVRFSVDAYPDRVFKGIVRQVRINPTTVQNVVTYTTVVDFDNPELKLFPGMTAYVTLPVATASNVLKVANGALRYKPDLKPEEVRSLFQRYGIEAPGGRSGASPAKAAAASRPPAQQGGSPAERAPREPRYDVSVVWKLLPDGNLQPVKLKTGITDHTFTELTQVLQGGGLNEGDELVTGAKAARTASSPVGGMPRR